MTTVTPHSVAKGEFVADAHHIAAGALVALDRALAQLRAMQPAPVRRLSPDDAIGFVLAEPLVAAAAIPAGAIALKDGYAVSAADLVGASPYSPVSLPSPPERVSAGHHLPTGADAILSFDAVAWQANRAEATQAVPPGQDVRRPGEDARMGAVLREAGRIVRPLDAAIARASAIQDVAVRPVRLTILEEGEQRLATGALIAAFAVRCGAWVTSDGASRQSEADITVAIADDPSSILHEADEIVAPGMAIRPGERIACAMRDGRPLLVVPPRLDVALAACLLVLHPCLAHLTGASTQMPDVAGRLTRRLSSAPGLTDLVLLRRAPDGGLEPLASGQAGFAALAGAEAWLAIPPESEGLPEGAPVMAFSLAEFLR